MHDENSIFERLRKNVFLIGHIPGLTVTSDISGVRTDIHKERRCFHDATGTLRIQYVLKNHKFFHVLLHYVQIIRFYILKEKPLVIEK